MANEQGEAQCENQPCCTSLNCGLKVGLASANAASFLGRDIEEGENPVRWHGLGEDVLLG